MSQPPSRRRRRGGFRQAALALDAQFKAAAERRGFAVARLLTHWPEIVGDEIARHATPLRLSHRKDGMGATLTLLTTGARAPLIEMQAPAIRERVNACYGYNAVSRIRLTQTAPDGLAEDRAVFRHAPPRDAAADPETRRAATALVGPTKDPELADALTRLAALMLTREVGTSNRKA